MTSPRGSDPSRSNTGHLGKHEDFLMHSKNMDDAESLAARAAATVNGILRRFSGQLVFRINFQKNQIEGNRVKYY